MQIQMECPPYLRGTRWKTYHHKEAKETGSEYYNYNGCLSMVLLALVDTKYRFLWVDVGSSGSSTDAQIFNQQAEEED